MIITERQLRYLTDEEWHPFSTLTREHFNEILPAFREGTLDIEAPQPAEPLQDSPEYLEAVWFKHRHRFNIPEPREACIEFKPSKRSGPGTPACLHVDRRRLHPVTFLLLTHGFLTGQEAGQWGHRYIDRRTGVPMLQGRRCNLVGCCNPSHYRKILLPHAYTPITLNAFALGDLTFDWELARF